MRIRATVAVVTAVLAITLVGCDSNSDGDSADTTKASASAAPSASATGDAAEAPADDSPADSGADDSGDTGASGVPAELTGAERAAVLAVVFDVSPQAASDEDEAIDAARDQCAALDSGVANPDHAAAERFSYSGKTLTDDQGAHINYGLRKTLCPKS